MNGILMDYLTIKSMGNHQTSEVSNWENQELGEFPLGPSHAWCGVGTQRRDVKHRWVIWCFGLEERSLWKKWNGGVLGECLWILLLAVYSVGIRCNMHHWDPLMSSFFLHVCCSNGDRCVPIIFRISSVTASAEARRRGLQWGPWGPSISDGS